MVHVLGMEPILRSNKKLMKIIAPTLIFVLLIVILNIRTKVSTLIGNSQGMRRPIGSRFRNGKSMRSSLKIELNND